MANRVFQNVIAQMKDSVGSTIGVVDTGGVVVACSDPARMGEAAPGVAEQFPPTGGVFAVDGTTYCTFLADQHSDYAAFIDGTDMQAVRYLNLLAVCFQNILQYHDEKFDKANFIKNVVLENILPGDIYAKARELHFATDVERVVLLIRVTNGNDLSAFEIVSSLFPEKQRDFVFNVSETDTVLAKEIQRGIDEKDIYKLAASIIDTLSEEQYIKAVVGIGSPIGNLKDLAASFKEAQIALEVGKVFDTDQSIVSYNHLGIARLIYQLPTTLCEMFLKEVFNQGSIDSLDEETLFTIQRFFENNQNVSETSRGLFVHRNTLVYRLEKIKKLTGLDLREFDDAIVFKVALMVKRYLNSNPSKY
ncbi:MAG: helix-turn-helix domain-containing protein [Candidatus Izemoplasmatales bacterium]|nr:helix-turn-helix domain-containing protein [Candidatus Izemoplasmatales bacterium]